MLGLWAAPSVSDARIAVPDTEGWGVSILSQHEVLSIVRSERGMGTV